MTVYGYVRVSTEEQVEGTSLAEQRRAIEGLALQYGLGEVTMLVDGGVSGAMPIFARPAGRLLKEVGKGDTVLVSKLDRFSRNAADALTVIHGWEQLDVRLIIGGFGDVLGEHSRGTAGRLLLEIMAVFAGHERRVLKERQREGQQAKKKQGGHIGGNAPFGFRKVGAGRAARLEPVPEQQEAIRLIHELRGQGMSFRKIVVELRDRTGLQVSIAAVHRICAGQHESAAVSS